MRCFKGESATSTRIFFLQPLCSQHYCTLWLSWTLRIDNTTNFSNSAHTASKRGKKSEFRVQYSSQGVAEKIVMRAEILKKKCCSSTQEKRTSEAALETCEAISTYSSVAWSSEAVNDSTFMKFYPKLSPKPCYNFYISISRRIKKHLVYVIKTNTQLMTSTR